MIAVGPAIAIMLVVGLAAIRGLMHVIEYCIERLDEDHERAAFVEKLKRVLIKW